MRGDDGYEVGWALRRLADQWDRLPWDFRETDVSGRLELVSQWLGSPDDDIMVVVFDGARVSEPYHAQDFFFADFAYRGGFDVLSADEENLVHIREGDCYVGQPMSGYALRGDEPAGIVMVGVHIRREAFFREYLPALAGNPEMLRFFLQPRANSFSEEFVHVSLEGDPSARRLVEMMAVEYATDGSDSQAMLKPLALALLLHVARMQRRGPNAATAASPAERATQLIQAHPESVTLAGLASELSYHPNYLSGMLRAETGRTFTQLVLEARMERASALLRGSELTVEEVARLVGYSNPSNFHKAFREAFGETPARHRGGKG